MDNPYILLPAQVDAINEIYRCFENNTNPICALPPGGGKTVVTCEIIRHFMKQGQFKILIIVKANNLNDPWKKELTKSKIKYNLIHGTERQEKRLNGRYEIANQRVLLTSHDTAALDIDYFTRMGIFDLVIIDEIHTKTNSKKITQTANEFSKINASKRLFLTATPIQNSELDLGHIHILLNEPEAIETVGRGSKNRKKILKGAYIDAIDKNIVVQPAPKTKNGNYDSKNQGVIKSKVILSVPIYKEMEEYIKGHYDYLMSGGRGECLASKRMEQFLSHPKTIFKNNTVIKETVPCAKVDAVEMIIRNTLPDEKVLVFSLYKDVLHRYYESLKNIGYESIIITGEDKGKGLEEKINKFKASGAFKVLLTTLFKSSEGINLPEANHVIVLDFWWNPQKIFQAIGRIDRVTQDKDIFTYLLCYNKDGQLYGNEIYYYDVMERKKESAKSVIHSQEDFPDFELFVDEMTFKDELELFLVSFTSQRRKRHRSKNTRRIVNQEEIIKSFNLFLENYPDSESYNYNKQFDDIELNH